MYNWSNLAGYDIGHGAWVEAESRRRKEASDRCCRMRTGDAFRVQLIIRVTQLLRFFQLACYPLTIWTGANTGGGAVGRGPKRLESMK